MTRNIFFKLMFALFYPWKSPDLSNFIIDFTSKCKAVESALDLRHVKRVKKFIQYGYLEM